ncbi:MAG TPA: hypothetical protein V6D14_28035 [Coleofasciculaceae cyanobacterium]
MEANQAARELLLKGTTILEPDGKQHTVHFIDFDPEHRDRNNFLVINQYRVDPSWATGGLSSRTSCYSSTASPSSSSSAKALNSITPSPKPYAICCNIPTNGEAANRKAQKGYFTTTS